MWLWHDDVREPPKDGRTWAWAQDNTSARFALANNVFAGCSLDHDMGAAPGDGLYAKGDHEDDGTKLVEWMIAEKHVPPFVIIHSWNHVAAKRMWYLFHDAGYPAEIKPYEIPAQEYFDKAREKENKP